MKRYFGAVFILSVLLVPFSMTAYAISYDWMLKGTTVTLIVVAGQSNSTSRATETIYNNDLPIPGIYQLARTFKAPEPIIPAYEPLHNWDINPHGVGYAYAFAVAYKKVFPETLLILPAAKGESGLDPLQWGPGGKWSTDLVARVNYLASRTKITRCIFLWQQGETEVLRKSTTYTQDVTKAFDAMYAGAPVLKTCTLLVGGLADDFVTDNKPWSDFVMNGIKGTFATSFVATSGLATADRTHFTALSQRALAERLFKAYRAKTGR